MAWEDNFVDTGAISGPDAVSGAGYVNTVYYWSDPTGTTPNNGAGVQNSSLFGSSTASNGSDQWTGFFQSALGAWSNLALAKNAQSSGLVPTRAANGQTVYQPTGLTIPGTSGGTGTLLLIVAAVVGAVMLAKD